MESNMEEDKAHGLCAQHGTHCKAIEYLEDGQNQINQDIKKGVVDLKDARSSMRHDFQRFEDGIKEGYVSKAEFEPIKKLVYGLAGLMLAYAAKMVLL